MFIQRFGKKHKLNIVGVYKKGKAGKLSIDNIRFVIDDYFHLFNEAYDSSHGLILCMPKKPTFDKSHPIFERLNLSTCAMTGLSMNDRPEMIGDLDVIGCNIDISLDHLKVKNYNYYKLDINSEEIKTVILNLTEEISCFSQ